MLIKMKSAFVVLSTLIPPGWKRLLKQSVIHNQQVPFLFTSKINPQQSNKELAGTHLVNEAMHGIGYGACFGVLLGVYVLFCPLWVTVSPAWYTNAPWYVIVSITTLSSILLLGCGAAVLGSHVLNSKTPKTE